MDRQGPKRKMLVRDIKRAALTRLEGAARTEKDFNEVVRQWNTRDESQRKRVDRWEKKRPEPEMLHWDRVGADIRNGRIKGWLNTVIPAPLNHEWWRHLLAGDFTDIIHDCPYEMHELTTTKAFSDALKSLNENQLEVLYYWAIRQESVQKIAKRRGQTDRNILKVYATLIRKLRRKMYEHWETQYDAGFSLTYAQKQFVLDCRNGVLDVGKDKKKNPNVDRGMEG